MRRKAQFLSLIALCAMALFFGMWAVASAEDPTTTTTTTTSASSTTSDSSTTTSSTSTTASTTTTTEVQWWIIYERDMTAMAGLVPSFVSFSNGRLAWTGTTPGGYSGMYIFDIATQKNTKIPEPLPGNYYNPCSDGSLVVYQGGRAGGYDDIYMYDTGNGTVQQITHNTDPGDGNDWNPRLDDGRIVWEKHMLGTGAKSGIYLYDMNEGTVTCVLEGEQYRSPDVWGDYVVCVKDAETGNGSEIILYNVKSKTSTSIAGSNSSNEHPRIDSGYVVWSSGAIPNDVYYPWDTYQIMIYGIADNDSVALTDNAFGNSNPSIGGGIVLWEQNEPSAIAGVDYVNEARGTFSEGLDVRAPDCAEGGAAWYADNSLFYAIREPNGPAFIDVGESNPYSTAIAAMAEKKIIEGYSGDNQGYFGPYDPVTRQQFAKMILLTMAQWKPSVYTPTLRDQYNFADSSAIEHAEGELYAYHYVAKAASTGLTKGYPDGTFRPLDNISRQQVITMIVRAGGNNLAIPPKGWQGVLSYVSPEHGYRIWVAEYNGLLDGIVGGTWGGLSGWDTRLNATRGEVAQMLYNLLNKLQGAN